MERFMRSFAKAVRSGNALRSRVGVRTVGFRQNKRFLAFQASKNEATGFTGRKHRSNAEDLISKMPVVVVDGSVAACDGGGGNLGHPIEYIKLNKVNVAEPTVCKYCGTRYVMKQHHH